MKAIAYNIQPHEKEFLTLANGKRHDVTLISNELNDKTALFAQGKEVVIVGTADVLNPAMVHTLSRAGVQKVIVREGASLAPQVLSEAAALGMEVVNTPADTVSPAQVAQRTVDYLHRWESEKAAQPATDLPVGQPADRHVPRSDTRRKHSNQ